MAKKKEKFNRRTREHFERAGWIVEDVEHYNAYSGTLKDFGGFADQLIWLPVAQGLEDLGPIRKQQTVALQICRHDDWTKRRRKIITNGRALAWLLAGNEIWIIGWRVTWSIRPNVAGRMQKQKSYAMELHILGVEDFKEGPILEIPVVHAEEFTQPETVKELVRTKLMLVKAAGK